jgi:hypothetical protein
VSTIILGISKKTPLIQLPVPPTCMKMANSKPSESAPLLMATAVPIHQQQPTMVPGVVVMNRFVQQPPEHIVYNSIIEDYLTNSPGLLVREKLYLSQILFGACEKQVQFKVANWDYTFSDDAGDDAFTSRPAQFMIKEKSECLQRYCCHQFRHLQLGVFPMGGTMHDTNERSGWPIGVEHMLEMEKPCNIPVVCFCCMFCKPEMTVKRPKQRERNILNEEYFGRAIFDWKWWNCFWPCEQYMSIRDHDDVELYSLRRPVCCSTKDGCFVNCCAPSCCNSVSFSKRECITNIIPYKTVVCHLLFFTHTTHNILPRTTIRYTVHTSKKMTKLWAS